MHSRSLTIYSARVIEEFVAETFILETHSSNASTAIDFLGYHYNRQGPAV